jgi:DNA-binding transcriptional MerR regulator
MSEEQEFIDVDFEAIARNINGKPSFQSTSQVASILGEKDSTVRFWTKKYKDLLDVEISNKNRRYKESDVAKLLFIKKLRREDGLTVDQVSEYCQKKGFDKNEIEKSIIDGSNPLAIQTFTTAMNVEMDKRFGAMQEKILELQRNLNEQLQETIVTTVDEVVSEKLDSAIDMVKVYIDKKELAAKERDTKLIDSMKEDMRVTKEQYDLEQNKKHQLWLIAWFQSIFHKKK